MVDWVSSNVSFFFVKLLLPYFRGISHCWGPSWASAVKERQEVQFNTMLDQTVQTKKYKTGDGEAHKDPKQRNKWNQSHKFGSTFFHSFDRIFQADRGTADLDDDTGGVYSFHWLRVPSSECFYCIFSVSTFLQFSCSSAYLGVMKKEKILPNTSTMVHEWVKSYPAQKTLILCRWFWNHFYQESHWKETARTSTNFWQNSRSRISCTCC